MQEQKEKQKKIHSLQVRILYKTLHSSQEFTSYEKTRNNFSEEGFVMIRKVFFSNIRNTLEMSILASENTCNALLVILLHT